MCVCYHNYQNINPRLWRTFNDEQNGNVEAIWPNVFQNLFLKFDLATYTHLLLHVLELRLTFVMYMLFPDGDAIFIAGISLLCQR